MGTTYDDVKQSLNVFSDIVRGFDVRLQKCEQLELKTFSYLMNKLDKEIPSLSNKISKTDSISASNKIDINKIYKNLSDLSKSVEYLQKDISELKEAINQIQLVIKPKRKKKRKRPLFFFIQKHFIYRNLCKERKIFYKELEERKIEQERERQIRLKIEEENRIKKEKENQQKIKNILSNMK